MFEFAWPWMAAILIVPFLVRWFWPRVIQSDAEEPIEGRQTTLLHPAVARLQASFNGRRPRNPITGQAHALLMGLFWGCLTLALMRPQWLEPFTEVRTPGYDLMLAIDTSRSMTALDFSKDGRPVDRMAVVKGVMERFISGREGDRVGLVIFGNQAFLQSPLTLDRDAVRGILRDVEPGMAGNATAMGDAIALGVKKLRERPPGSRVLILITDGESTSGIVPPLEAARLALGEGVRIYTIGVGSNESEVMVMGGDGQYKKEAEMGMDEETLTKVARATGGAYFRATDTHALDEISAKIENLEKTEAENFTTYIPSPLYRWPLGIALLAWLVLGLFPEGRMRTPRRADDA